MTTLALFSGVHAEHVRVPYNVARAATAIKGSLLPDDFAGMLRDAH